MKLYCATTNAGKLREFRQIIEHYAVGRIELESLTGIQECEETGVTFEENAGIKAVHYSVHAPGPLFADDSGLEVDALGGAPGIYSARFAGEHAGDAANNALLLEKMNGVGNRAARFVCAIALAEAGKVIATYRGTVEGQIIDAAAGPNGFGYDPLFFYKPFGRTFGEATGEEKMFVSHRGQAMAKMISDIVSR
jgi:XTP/dITP diphosphohydrolase